MNYEKLIEKYETNVYVKGERYSKEYDSQRKQKQAVKSRHMIANILFNEVSFNLNKNEKEQIHYLIDKFKNFRDLHGRASNECIILAFIFYVKIQNKHDIRVERYSISKKYRLTDKTFEIILCKIILQLLQETEIKNIITTAYDHELLIKGEIK